MRLVAGVYQIRLPFPQNIPAYTNVYIIEGEKGNILVDSGWDWPGALWAFREGMRSDSLKFQDINWIVITHTHPDHYGLAGKLKDLCEARIAMHRLEAELINSRYKSSDVLLNKMSEELEKNGVPQDKLTDMRDASLWMHKFVSSCQPEIILDEGDKISNGTFEFEVLRTPGHSQGHICLYEPNKKWLFSGDHVLFQTVPHVGLHPQSGDNPLEEYIKSLNDLKAMKIQFIFPGHGPVFNSLKLRAAEILQHHDQRRKDILKVLDEGLKTAYQIAVEIPWKGRSVVGKFSDLTPLDRRLAILHVMAQLKLLDSEGELGRIDQEGVYLYLKKS